MADEFDAPPADEFDAPPTDAFDAPPTLPVGTPGPSPEVIRMQGLLRRTPQDLVKEAHSRAYTIKNVVGGREIPSYDPRAQFPSQDEVNAQLARLEAEQAQALNPTLSQLRYEDVVDLHRQKYGLQPEAGVPRSVFAAAMQPLVSAGEAPIRALNTIDKLGGEVFGGGPAFPGPLGGLVERMDAAQQVMSAQGRDLTVQPHATLPSEVARLGSTIGSNLVQPAAAIRGVGVLAPRIGKWATALGAGGSSFVNELAQGNSDIPAVARALVEAGTTHVGRAFEPFVSAAPRGVVNTLAGLGAESAEGAASTLGSELTDAALDPAYADQGRIEGIGGRILEGGLMEGAGFGMHAAGAFMGRRGRQFADAFQQDLEARRHPTPTMAESAVQALTDPTAPLPALPPDTATGTMTRDVRGRPRMGAPLPPVFDPALADIQAAAAPPDALAPAQIEAGLPPVQATQVPELGQLAYAQAEADAKAANDAAGINRYAQTLQGQADADQQAMALAQAEADAQAANDQQAMALAQAEADAQAANDQQAMAAEAERQAAFTAAPVPHDLPPLPNAAQPAQPAPAPAAPVGQAAPAAAPSPAPENDQDAQDAAIAAALGIPLDVAEPAAPAPAPAVPAAVPARSPERSVSAPPEEHARNATAPAVSTPAQASTPAPAAPAPVTPDRITPQAPAAPAIPRVAPPAPAAQPLDPTRERMVKMGNRNIQRMSVVPGSQVMVGQREHFVAKTAEGSFVLVSPQAGRVEGKVNSRGERQTPFRPLTDTGTPVENPTPGSYATYASESEAQDALQRITGYQPMGRAPRAVGTEAVYTPPDPADLIDDEPAAPETPTPAVAAEPPPKPAVKPREVADLSKYAKEAITELGGDPNAPDLGAEVDRLVAEGKAQPDEAEMVRKMLAPRTPPASTGAIRFGWEPDSPMGKLTKAVSDYTGAAMAGTKAALTSETKALEQARAENPDADIQTRSNDLARGVGGVMRSFVLPNEIAFRQPNFAPVKDAATDRRSAIHEEVVETAEASADFQKVAEDPAARAKVNAVIDEQRAQRRDFTPEELSAKGLNPTEVKAVQQHRILTEKTFKNLVDAAFLQAGFQPDTLDNFAAETDRLEAEGGDAATVAARRAVIASVTDMEARKRPGYTRLVRPRGKYVVFAKGANGETVYSTRVEKASDISGAMAKARTYGEPDNMKLSAREVEYLDRFQDIGTTPQDLLHIAEIARLSPAASKELMEKMVPKLTQENIRRSLMQSEDIPGYDPNHMHATSRAVVGSIMAVENARLLNTAREQLTKMDDQPELRKYTTSYTQSQLEPDKAAAKFIRAAAFYAGPAIAPMTIAVNLAQAPLIHAPFLVSLGGSPSEYANVFAQLVDNSTPVAMARALIRKTEDGKPFSLVDAHVAHLEKNDPALGEILRSMQRRGELGGNIMTDWLDSTMDKGIAGRSSNTAIRVLGTAFAESERMNRMASAITAYHLFRNKASKPGFWNNAKSMGYRGPTGTRTDAAKAFTEWAVRQTNYEYGKSNRPPLANAELGHESIGQIPVGAMAYSMRHYAFSTLGLVSKMIRAAWQAADQKDRAKILAGLGAGFIGFMLAGGIRNAIPGSETAYDAIQKIARKGGNTNMGMEEALSEAEKWMSEYTGEFAAKTATQGLGRAVGSPLMEAYGKKAGMENLISAPRSLWDLLGGAPGGMAQRAVEGVSDVVSGGNEKNRMVTPGQAAANIVSPVGNIYRAWNQAKTGEIIDRRGEVQVPAGQATVSPLATAVGVEDPTIPLRREGKRTEQAVKASADRARGQLIRDMTIALRTDPAGIEGVVKRLAENNQKAIDSGVYENVITTKQLKAGVMAEMQQASEGQFGLSSIRRARPQDRPALLRVYKWLQRDVADVQDEETPAE